MKLIFVNIDRSFISMKTINMERVIRRGSLPMSKIKNNDSQVIVIVALLTAISLFGDSMLYIALPIFWEEAGLNSIWQVGVLLSVNRFIRLPFNPLIGWLYHKISLKTGFIIAISLGSLTTLGYGLFNGFLAWVILRGIWGIAWSFFRIGGLSVIALHAEENNRGKSMGLYNGIYRLGSLVGMLAGGILVPIIGLDIVSVIFGCMTLCGLPFIFIYMKNTSSENKSISENAAVKMKLLDYISKRNLAIIITGFCVTLLIQGVLTSTLSSVLEYHHGEQIELFGMIVNVTFISGLILSVRWVWEPFLGERFGHWSDGQRGRIPLLLMTLIISCITFGLLSSNLPIVLFILIILIVLIGATALTTIVDAIAIDASKTTNVVSFLTTYSIVQDLGAAIGPFISFILLGLNNGILFIYIGGAGILLGLVFLWLPSYLRERQERVHLNI